MESCMRATGHLYRAAHFPLTVYLEMEDGPNPPRIGPLSGYSHWGNDSAFLIKALLTGSGFETSTQS